MRTLNRTFITLYHCSRSKTQKELGDDRIDLVRDTHPPIERGGRNWVKYRLAGTDTAYDLDSDIRATIENTIERRRLKIVNALEQSLRETQKETRERIGHQIAQTTGLEGITDKLTICDDIGVRIQFVKVYWDDNRDEDDE